MDSPFTRQEALAILTTYLKNKNLLKHSYAAEAAMKAIYRRLNLKPNALEEEKWGITGLLHDADYELCKDHPEIHGLKLFELVPNKIPEDITYAIKSHNYQNTQVMPKSSMDWAIATCDQLTGLIVATALVHPEKKLFYLTPNFVLKKFNNKSFAKGAERSSIKMCEEKLNIALYDFIDIILKAMQGVSGELGL